MNRQKLVKTVELYARIKKKRKIGVKYAAMRRLLALSKKKKAA